jgi:hypothetical protein
VEDCFVRQNPQAALASILLSVKETNKWLTDSAPWKVLFLSIPFLSALSNVFD